MDIVTKFSEPAIIALILSVVRYFVLNAKSYPNAYLMFFIMTFILVFYYKKDVKLALIFSFIALCLRLIYRTVAFSLSDSIKNDSFHMSNNLAFFFGTFLTVFFVKYYI